VPTCRPHVPEHQYRLQDFKVAFKPDGASGTKNLKRKIARLKGRFKGNNLNLPVHFCFNLNYISFKQSEDSRTFQLIFLIFALHVFIN